MRAHKHPEFCEGRLIIYYCYIITASEVESQCLSEYVSTGCKNPLKKNKFGVKKCVHLTHTFYNIIYLPKCLPNVAEQRRDVTKSAI